MTVPSTAPRAQSESEAAVTRQVLDSFRGTPDPRLREIIGALVTHLHEFARDIRLTEAEWDTMIRFLTDVGHITDDRRQEFILLSDVLGLSMLTIGINHPAEPGATESTVFGPFFVDDAPLIELGGDIAGEASGEPSWVDGTVRDLDGAPIAGARIEVWEADDEGHYDVQYDDGRTAGRAHLFSDDDGNFRFWGVTPTPYPIPADGPVGRLLAATNRSPMRAPHLHFMVAAPGFRTLVTHIFVAGDPYLARDSVFGVKESLIVDFDRHPSTVRTPDGREVDDTWTSARFDIVLIPDDESAVAESS